jgi:hypothetical protein
VPHGTRENRWTVNRFHDTKRLHWLVGLQGQKEPARLVRLHDYKGLKISIVVVGRSEFVSRTFSVCTRMSFISKRALLVGERASWHNETTLTGRTSC